MVFFPFLGWCFLSSYFWIWIHFFFNAFISKFELQQPNMMVSYLSLSSAFCYSILVNVSISSFIIIFFGLNNWWCCCSCGDVQYDAFVILLEFIGRSFLFLFYFDQYELVRNSERINNWNKTKKAQVESRKQTMLLPFSFSFFSTLLFVFVVFCLAFKCICAVWRCTSTSIVRLCSIRV